MRHPALRRSARHMSKRRNFPPGGMPPPSAEHDLSPQKNPPSTAPADGDHNQGGTRQEGLDYQRDLGLEQDS
jgi:hypothetical protein